MPTAAERLSAAVARLDGLSNWEKRPRERMRVTLDPVRDLLERLGNPHAGARVVHVAGSKGKGSVSALVAAGLGRAGLRCGLYASPHVERMNERVAVDGEAVGDGELAEALERALEVRARAAADGTAGREATWFDTVTAAALLIFARAGVPWIVAECGLGGRLDSTNVLSGDVCVITGIELEHTAVLGGTRALIAAEKAGILDPGCVVVTGLDQDDEAGRVVAARARELGVRLVPATGLESVSIAGRNRRLAGLALDELGRLGHRGAAGEPLSASLLDSRTIERARLPARLERRRRAGIDVVLDGAHTPNSARDVLRDLAAEPGLARRPVAVLGLGREKDLAGILKALSGRVDRVVCTSVGSSLHRTPEEIGSAARAAGLAAETAAPPRTAFDRALDLAARSGTWVLVIGSLYLAGEIRPLLAAESDHRTC